jgi:hypothetical protein
MGDPNLPVATDCFRARTLGRVLNRCLPKGHAKATIF